MHAQEGCAHFAADAAIENPSRQGRPSKCRRSAPRRARWQTGPRTRNLRFRGANHKHGRTGWGRMVYNGTRPPRLR